MLFGILIAVLIVVVVLAIYNPGILMQVDSTIKQYAEPYVEQYASSDSAVMKPVGVTRDIARTSDVSAIQNALLQYRLENGIYPDDMNKLVPDYIAEVRKDPATNESYEYTVQEAGQSYELCIAFESKEHSCISPQ